MADDYTEAVTWLFAALEAAIAALADQHGVTIEPKHWKKADAAVELYAQQDLARDIQLAVELAERGAS
ncbi:MAG TPA: hypothetical protein VHT29_08640 [Solirubrobacteraceae bacterium]|jgi:hypothetical protein|nr:hypothetical protein [Solirubrobacteraceae bacterium]